MKRLLCSFCNWIVSVWNWNGPMQGDALYCVLSARRGNDGGWEVLKDKWPLDSKLELVEQARQEVEKQHYQDVVVYRAQLACDMDGEWDHLVPVWKNGRWL